MAIDPNQITIEMPGNKNSPYVLGPTKYIPVIARRMKELGLTREQAETGLWNPEPKVQMRDPYFDHESRI